MRFVLHEIKLWFKNDAEKPKSYNFLPNKINVVTGDATTGKTSFWSIIDYCLLTNKVKLVPVISEKISWYGIRFSINGKELSIARMSPQMDVVSPEVYYGEGPLPELPHHTNQIPKIKSLLDAEFGITDKLRFPYGKEMGLTSFNLSYRHFLLFNLLSENIIGDSDAYFDVAFFGKDEYNSALRHIFDLVIGVNDMENIKAQERLITIGKEIRNIGSLQTQKRNTEAKFVNGLYGLIEKLRKNSIIEYELVVDSIEAARFVIDEAIANTKKAASNNQLFKELEDLNREKEEIRNQIMAIGRYRKEYGAYIKNLQKSADSLKPIEFLNKNLSEQLLNSYETKVFVDSLESSLRIIQESLEKRKEPIRVSGDEKELEARLSILEKNIDRLNSIKKNYQEEGFKFMILGEVKNQYENLLSKSTFPKLINTDKLNELNDEKQRLEKNVLEIKSIRYTMQTALNESIQRNYNLLSSLPEYKNYQTVFNEETMILRLKPQSEIFPIETVGSKSNYMFMHLCFFLGLHEHMISIGQMHVPQFLFIDQPSIPFYTGEGGKGNNDKSKLIDAFSLLNSFIDYILKEKKSTFQIFMVEHANKDYWIDNNLTNFYTVDEFIHGNGLIPKDIYNL